MKKVIILALAVFLIGLASASSVVSVNWADIDQGGTEARTIRDDVFVLKVNTIGDRVYCRYSTNENELFVNMNYFEENLETLHKKIFSGFTTSIVKRYYTKCIPIEYKTNGTNPPEPTGQLEIIVTVDPPISAQITIGNEYLTEGQHKISLITTEIPLDDPELSYSYDGVSYKKISLQGSEKEWMGYITISKSEGEKVGSFKFLAKDLEGNSGEKIISGGSFKVDTKAPSSVNSLEATGRYKQIELEWSTTEEDIEYINIYRSTSPDVGFNDFYEEFNDPEEEKYFDEGITTGKIYYYRIAPVDEAGNEASLSAEVSASSRSDNSTSSKTGLSSNLFYLVDSTVTEIESLESQIEDSKESLNDVEESERELLEYTGIFDEITSASSELTALKKEVVGYKLQDITESVLKSRLDSARLKLNIIRKRVPEKSEILEESSSSLEVSKENVDLLTLEYSPSLTSMQANKASRDAIKMMSQNNFKIVSEARIFDITYLDGTKSKQTVISHSIPSSLEGMSDYSILLRMPNSINYDDVSMETKGYQELSNHLLEFESDTKKIVYTIDDEIEPKILDDIMISLVKHSGEQSTITGNSIINISAPGLGITVLILVVFSLALYLTIIRRKQSANEASIFIEKAQEVNNLQKSGKHKEAKELYESLKLDYISLSKENKLKVFDKVSHLHKK